MSIIKSFGTVLKNNPLVLKDSQQYSTVSASGDILNIELPKNFDGREAWKGYIKTPVRNQGKCGNCWAQAACNMLEDRYAIQSYGIILPGDEELSAIHLTICEYQRDIDFKELRDNMTEQEKKRAEGHSSSACNGNSLYNAADFLYRYGVPTRSCISRDKYNEWCKTLAKPCGDLNEYTSDENLPTCEDLLGKDYDTCLDRKTAARRYRAIGIYNVPSTEREIMYEIYRWGSIMCGFQTFSDYLNGYDGKTIYMHQKRNEAAQGGHAITIIGWGEEMVKVTVGNEGKIWTKESDGPFKERLVKFWHIENSWSDKWGNGGFSRIEKYLPGLQLEENLVACIPDIPYMVVKCLPGTMKFLQESKDDEKRKDFGIDDMTGYRYATIEKIRAGTLEGDLTPLITIDDVPDYCEFIAGTSLKIEDDFREAEKKRELEEIKKHEDDGKTNKEKDEKKDKFSPDPKSTTNEKKGKKCVCKKIKLVKIVVIVILLVILIGLFLIQSGK